MKLIKVASNLNCCYFHLLVASNGDSFQQPELYDFDHIHFNSNTVSPVTILYGALGTDCFREFHVTLVQAAKEVCCAAVEVCCFLILYFRFSFTYKPDNIFDFPYIDHSC